MFYEASENVANGVKIDFMPFTRLPLRELFAQRFVQRPLFIFGLKNYCRYTVYKTLWIQSFHCGLCKRTNWINFQQPSAIHGIPDFQAAAGAV